MAQFLANLAKSKNRLHDAGMKKCENSDTTCRIVRTVNSCKP